MSAALDAGTIAGLVRRAARFLPAQGPIAAFVHHNTLHAFEDLPFAEAVAKAGELYHCEPYLSEDRYRCELERGRIRERDLEAVLDRELGSAGRDGVVGSLPTSRLALRLAMLRDPVRVASDAELHWVVASSGALQTFRRKCPAATREHLIADTRRWTMRELRGDRESNRRARGLAADLIARFGESHLESWPPSAWEELTLTLLWRVCRHGVHSLSAPSGDDHAATAARPRECWLAATGEDADLLVHEVLVRFCAAFADQGFAGWELPERERGFFQAFAVLHRQRGIAGEPWMAGLPAELDRLATAGFTAEDCIADSLRLFGVSDSDRESVVVQSLLALRGWAGMLWQMESRPDRVGRPAPKGTLLEFLAVRLVLDRLALDHLARERIAYRGELSKLPAALRRHLSGHHADPIEATPRHSRTRQAYLVFLLAQSLGWTPRALFQLASADWEVLVREIESFSSLERRRIFHLAYERHYRIQTLDALGAHARQDISTERPALQVVCCIDEREESFRRHLEEGAPGIETFGAAGFFGVAMYYRGLWEAHEMPLCPVAIRPRYRVTERVQSGEEALQARAASRMRRFALAARHVHAGSRSFWLGILTALLGALAALPLVARVLFPRLAALLRRRAHALVRHKVRTELALKAEPLLETTTSNPADEPNGIRDGLTAEEMAGIVERLLRDIGLTARFARLVIVAGHGSSSLNNPHEAAHDCGACGGGRGGPNARAFARMANDPEVRVRLARNHLHIPEDTVFLGAYHNTCDESVEFYDLEALPDSHQVDFRWARRAIHRAGGHNAHERCRRFRSAPVDISPEGARRHVEARAEDLAQPRPEFGHATNAICVVGRRERTRGLFMDRRAFLVSYDPVSEQGDPARPILTRILEAVVPVCGGINLEYYFSYVDPTGWGCGSKLPHNITSLVGVMDGSSSDLRPGLPWQMIEIHEPVRLLLVVETPASVLAGILARHEGIGRFCRNDWIQLATLDPESAEMSVYQDGEFVPYEPESRDLPAVDSSRRWYGGLREHLEFASVLGGNPPASPQ